MAEVIQNGDVLLDPAGTEDFAYGLGRIGSGCADAPFSHLVCAFVEDIRATLDLIKIHVQPKPSPDSPVLERFFLVIVEETAALVLRLGDVLRIAPTLAVVCGIVMFVIYRGIRHRSRDTGPISGPGVSSVEIQRKIDSLDGRLNDMETRFERLRQFVFDK